MGIFAFNLIKIKSIPMNISSSFSGDMPRVTSNQLGEYVFASDIKKIRMLRDMKFGNVHRAPYYQAAFNGILKSFHDGTYDRQVLIQTTAELRGREAANRNQALRLDNNAEMLKRFADLGIAARPPVGEHTIVRRNATMELENVIISVRPEIVTENANTGLVSFTKLRFSKSKVTEDASEIILLILLKFGQQQRFANRQFDPKNTRLIDCFAKSVITGHMVGRIREQQLQAALREIGRQWPSIGPALG